MNQVIKKESLIGKVIIKPFSKKDVDILYELFNTITERDKYFFHPHLFDENTARKLVKEIGNPDIFRVLMTININCTEVVIGYGFLWDLNTEKPSLGIYIRNGYQDKKLGHILMEYLIGIAKNLNKKAICLTVYQDNKRAYHLYKKLGFRVQRIVQYMELDLDSKIDIN